MNHSTTTGKAAARYALPAASCLVSGLAAYLFVLTNKLVNLDEIAGLFSKGESISSGRWALALTSYIFPDLSMPWFNGILSLLLITALLSALLIVFPSQIVTFAYMFTCAPYALAVLLAVASVYFTLCASGWRRWAGSVISLCLSLGIYQANLSVAASLYVVYLIKRLIGNEWDVRRIVRCGLGCLAALAGALAALDERARALIVFRYYRRMSLKETAERLGVSYAYVKVLHKSALRTLREAMTK